MEIYIYHYYYDYMSNSADVGCSVDTPQTYISLLWIGYDNIIIVIIMYCILWCHCTTHNSFSYLTMEYKRSTGRKKCLFVQLLSLLLLLCCVENEIRKKMSPLDFLRWSIDAWRTHTHNCIHHIRYYYIMYVLSYTSCVYIKYSVNNVVQDSIFTGCTMFAIEIQARTETTAAKRSRFFLFFSCLAIQIHRRKIVDVLVDSSMYKILFHLRYFWIIGKLLLFKNIKIIGKLNDSSQRLRKNNILHRKKCTSKLIEALCTS